MRLVIEIPEEKLITIRNKMYCGIYDAKLYNIIANGTPLPKGHGRLIDAGKFIDILNNAQIEGLNTYKGLGRAKELLIETPTIVEADKAESEE